MKKMIGAVIAIIFVGFALSNTHSVLKVALAYAPVSLQATVQDPQPEGSKHCERPNPNNPDVGNKDPNKLGCACMRKCEGGKPTENYEEGKRCKVHCKPDQCDCPNPCKT